MNVQKGRNNVIKDFFFHLANLTNGNLVQKTSIFTLILASIKKIFFICIKTLHFPIPVYVNCNTKNPPKQSVF